VKSLLFLTAAAMLTLAAFAAYTLFESKDDPNAAARAAFQTSYDSIAARIESDGDAAKIALGDLLRDTPPEHGGDPAKAVAFYRAAAKNGFASAQARLGRMYEDGLGVPRDIGRAFEWYRIAAQVGNNADAQYALARLYYEGRGVLQDYGTAADWYLKAARGGHPVAQFIAGRMYRDGWGVTADAVEALAWLTLAAEHPARVSAADPDFRAVAERDALRGALLDYQVRAAERLADQRRTRS
jgi:TPR repeat protein